jgi:hypothetical protein
MGVTQMQNLQGPVLLLYSFTSCSRIFYLYGKVTIADEGLQTLIGLCLALRAFEQGGIFIVPHLL